MIIVRMLQYWNDYHKKERMEEFCDLKELEDWILIFFWRNQVMPLRMLLIIKKARRSDKIMYDPEYWRYCKGITVKQLCGYLQENIPADAIINVCGDDQFYMHLEKDGSVFSVDDCSLSDLPEYEDCDVEELAIEVTP